MRYYWLIIFLFSLSFANSMIISNKADNTNLTIYNQGKVFVEETREVDFISGDQIHLQIGGLLQEIIPSTFNLKSQKFNTRSRLFNFTPISEITLLKSKLGKTVELVKYSETGGVGFSTKGKLLSINPPIFDIEGKIVVDPPYEYIFDIIPQTIQSEPVMNLVGKSSKGREKIGVSYISNGLSWTTNYILKFNNSKEGVLSAWYQISNSTDKEFHNVNVDLASGAIKFAMLNYKKDPSQDKRQFEKMMLSSSVIMDDSQILKTEDHYLFKLPQLISIPAQNIVEHRFIFDKTIPIKKVYQIFDNSPRYNSPNETPATIVMKFNSKDCGDFHLPSGNIQVYSMSPKDRASFYGSAKIPLTRKGADVEISVGMTNDITGNFIQTSHEYNNKKRARSIESTFYNTKNKNVEIEWIVKLNGNWKISSKSHDFEKIDSHTIKFIIEIAKKSETKAYYTVKTENN